MHNQKVEVEGLVERFESSLLKKHNYVRIVKQYLKFCESENLQVNSTSKKIFIDGKAAVYKTALNKLFMFLGGNINFFVYSSIDAKIKAIEGINPKYYEGIASSSAETYSNVCILYQSLGYDIINPKESDFEEFMKRIEVKNTATETQLTYYSAIKKLFKVNKISTEFLDIKKPKQVKKKTNKCVLTSEERNKVWNYLLNNTTEKEICIIGLMLLLGLRSKEIVNLRKTEDGLFETKPKGNQEFERIDFNNAILFEKIDGYYELKKKLDSYFSKNKSFGYKETSSIRKMTARIAQQALGFHFSSHTCRFSASEYLKNKGVNEYVIQSILGHKNIASTGHYTGRSYEGIRTLYPKK